MLTQQWNICFERYVLHVPVQACNDAHALGLLNPNILPTSSNATSHKKPDYALYHADFVIAQAWNDEKLITMSTYALRIEYKILYKNNNFKAFVCIT